MRPTFTLNLGLRYELPGNWIDSLVELNQGIVAAAGGDERFALAPIPERDTNNFQPRVGFNWNPHTSGDGFLGFLTGGDKLVLRGGYARTHDYAFLNIALNVFSSFPQLATVTPPAPVANAWTLLPTLQPQGLNPDLLTRTIVSEDFRSPYADQFALEVQRQMTENLVLRVGYIGTRGHDLYQTLDGNPNQPFTKVRVNPNRGVIRLRDNTARSWYNRIDDVEKAFCVGGQGELPFQIGPGYEAPVADLAGPQNRFATLDYSEAPPLVYMGEYVEFEELHFSGLREIDGW